MGICHTLNRITVIAALTLAATPIYAGINCEAYEGTTVAPLKFAAALSALKPVPLKDEFETTAQYEQRLAATTPATALIIAKKAETSDLDGGTIAYDADKGELSVSVFAFSNMNVKLWDAKDNAVPAFDIRMFSRHSVIDIADKPIGTYNAQNAFGVKGQVTRINKMIGAIVEPDTESSPIDLFPKQPMGQYGMRISRLKSIALPPDQAKAIKASGSLAFVVTPKPPYRVKSTYVFQEPTVTSPFEITNKVDILVAKFECSLLLDPSNKVIGAYPN